MLIWGIVLGILFDIYRFILPSHRVKGLTQYIVDSIFWIIVTLSTFTAFVYSSFGQVRLYLLLGMVGGFMLYIKTLSKTTFRVLRVLKEIVAKVMLFIKKVIITIIKVIKKISILFLGVFKVVIFPLIFIGKILLTPLQKLGKKIKKFFKIKRK